MSTTIIYHCFQMLWQPLLSVEPWENSTLTIRPGTAAIFNVTLTVPYRTAGDVIVKADSNLGGNVQVWRYF